MSFMKKIMVLSMMAVAAGAAVAEVKYPETTLPSIRIKGRVGAYLDRMIAGHVAGTDVDYLTAIFKEQTETKGWWQTEFWGKYMHSAVPYAEFTGSAKIAADLKRGVDAVLAAQLPNGYVGNYPDELRCGEGWDVWGMKYTMLGLIHYHDYLVRRGENPDRVLTAAKKVCDYVIGEIGPKGKRGQALWQTGNWSGYASSSILEPVVWLYRRTGDRKYLDFAEYIVKGMIEPAAGPRLVDLALEGRSVADRNGPGMGEPDADGGYVMKHNRWKAYEMMSCYQGLLDYVETINVDAATSPRQNKDENHLRRGEGAASTLARDIVKAAIRTGESIIADEINLAGGCTCSEAWFHGAKKQHLPYVTQQETCVLTTWMRFCEKLLEVTDDPKWADQLEKTFYNAYLAAMKPDGREFACYTPMSGTRYHGHHHCFMHTNCCTANGPRGFLCFLREFFSTRGSQATFNFYGSATVEGFDMYSLYPRENYARITSHTAGRKTLRLRIPAWSEKTVVKVNGEALAGVKAGAYHPIDREWKLGDIVEVEFDMPVVSHLIGHHVAFTRGPVLLARDSRFADGDVAAPVREGWMREGFRILEFEPVRVPTDEMWMAFSARLHLGFDETDPEGRLPERVTFCDYASAGNEWRAGNYYRTWFDTVYAPTEK